MQIKVYKGFYCQADDKQNPSSQLALCILLDNTYKIENFILNVAFISYNTYLLKTECYSADYQKSYQREYSCETFPVNAESTGSPEPVL